MNLLFVTPQFPWPPTQGTALRNWHLLQAAASVHRVDLLTFGPAAPGEADSARPAGSGQEGAVLDRCRRVETVPVPVRGAAGRLRDLALGYADMERRLWSPAFAARLHALLSDEQYDVVQLEGFEVAGYLLGPAALRADAGGRAPWAAHGGAGPRIVFDDHNAEYELQASAARIDRAQARRWPRAAYSAVQWRRLRRREALYGAAADACLAVSDEDAAALGRLVPGLRPDVVPNGVDCAAMPPPAPGKTPVLFFSGKLDYRPNVDACEWLVRHVLPLVRRQVPEARVVLAGRDPNPAVRALATAARGVTVTGPLDDGELARLRAAAWVYVVPMRMGSGVRFKVLEAMAAGVPLVATPLGISGAGAVHGTHALVAETAASFAGAVCDLLCDPGRRVRQAAAARDLAWSQHDWRRITPRLLDVYDRLARAPGQPVSVITTVLNERASVAALGASLAAQTRRPDEVVAVDGGSRDGTPAALARAAGEGGLAVRVDEAPGANISQGRNRAVRGARCDVIACTDAGVELHPAWLERLIRPLEQALDVVAVSGFFVPAPRSVWELALGATTLPEVEEIDPARFLPSSRSLAFRRQGYARAGGYPEWLDYCEDLVFDLALREAAGPPRFAPRAVVRFRPRRSVRAFFLQYYRYARGDGKADLWRKRHAVRYASYLAGAILLRQAALGRGSRLASLALLAIGGTAYVYRPLIRLAHQSTRWADFVRAAPLIPVARLAGDVGKMLGYPAGLWWRVRRAQAQARRAQAQGTR